MIMAGEFESLWQPLLIMFTIPLSLIGVASGLFITNTPLSAVAYLGIIMLGGIAVNNGIVLIDFINVLRSRGYPAYEAVVEASKTRLRPILMTSLTTILGLLPLALGIGEGAELQAPLAITVMGGLTTATFLTLVFIPALYLIVAGRAKKTPAPAVAAAESLPFPAAASKEIEPEVKPAKAELNPRQKELLEKLKTLKKITRKDYAQMFGISVPTAARDLKELQDKGLIKAKGPLGPGRWYELT